MNKNKHDAKKGYTALQMSSPMTAY